MRTESFRLKEWIFQWKTNVNSSLNFEDYLKVMYSKFTVGIRLQRKPSVLKSLASYQGYHDMGYDENL